VNFSRFLVATHILRVNCTKMAKDRPGQPVYEICWHGTYIFNHLSFDLLNSRSFCTEASNVITFSRRIITLLLYTDCHGCRTAAIARHVSFAQITCPVCQFTPLAMIAVAM